MNKIIDQKLKKYVFVVFGIVVALYSFLNLKINIYSENSNIVSGIILLLVTLIMMIKNKNNKILFILFLQFFYFNYSIVIGRYIYKIGTTSLNRIRDVNTMGISINCLLLFISFVYILLAIFKKKESGSKKKISMCYEGKANTMLIGSFSIISLILIFFLGFERVSNGRGASSTIYEYSIIIFILSFYYLKRNKCFNRIMIALLILFSLQGLAYGERDTALQLIIIFYFYFLADSFSLKRTLVFFLLGIFVLNYIGIVRGSTLSVDMLFSSISSTFSNLFVLDTATHSYFASLVFVKVKNFVSFDVQINLFINFLKSVFLGGSIVNNFNLSIFTQNFISHGGGGWLPFYFYFWLGSIGIIVSSFIVGLHIKNVSNYTNKNKKDILKLLSIYFVSTTPRWYLYSPSALIRGVLIFFGFYFIFYLVRIVSKTN